MKQGVATTLFLALARSNESWGYIAAPRFQIPRVSTCSQSNLLYPAQVHDKKKSLLHMSDEKEEDGASSAEAHESFFTPAGGESLNMTAADDDTSVKTTTTASKREMLKFALPALGIYLANPLLSNIDNAFVGKTVGTQGLAALSPATICTDQMIYLFSFLSRATTGLVSRAYGSRTDPAEKKKAAAEAGSAPLTVALISGVFLSMFYAFFTPHLLAGLKVTPTLRGAATSYICWRGAIAWAALAQGVSLSDMMATRDANTPLKIIGLAAGVNVISDALLCVWPLRWGVSGAAAATSFATLFSSAFMVRGLKRKGILPRIRLPSKKELLGLSEFTGPLMAITVTRLIGFVSMQRAAMSLGVKNMAAYQLCINLVLFFLLFAEPLSQLSQTQLPALIDAEDGDQVKSNLKSVLALGGFTALGIGALAGLTVFFGAPGFSSDRIVQGLAKEAAPSVFLTVATAIFAGTVRWRLVKISMLWYTSVSSRFCYFLFCFFLD